MACFNLVLFECIYYQGVRFLATHREFFVDKDGFAVLRFVVDNRMERDSLRGRVNLNSGCIAESLTYNVLYLIMTSFNSN